MQPCHVTAADQARADDASIIVATSPSIRIAAVQPQLRANDTHPIDAARSVIDLMRREVIDSAQKGNRKADIFILPELCPIGYSEHTFQHYLDSDDALQTISIMIADFAKEHKAYVCYGTIGTCLPSPIGSDNKSELEQKKQKRRTIRQVVVNDLGKEIVSYDKIYLCDYGDCAETRFFVPGKKLCSFDCAGFRFGLIICSDIRYPALSRELAGSLDHKVDVVLQPAAFARDVSFRTWKSFRETRAVENGVFFVAANYSGNFFGETSVNPPWIDECNEPNVMGIEEGILIVDIERSTLDWARKAMPFYRHLCTEFGVDEPCSKPQTD